MNARAVRAWCLYDFGNSAFAILFPVMFGTYYADHVVGGGRGTTLWLYLGSASMAAVALSSPLLGGIADHAGVRKRMLALYTGLGVAAVLGFAGVGSGAVVFGFVLGAVANFAFEGGIVFYNAYLPDLVPPDRIGRVSARGFAVGYVGSLVALAIAAPFAARGWMTAVWAALALQWGLFALPAFRRLPPDRPTGTGVREAAARGLRQTFGTLREVAGMRDLRRFLLAYFFYIDGVNSVILFAAVYARQQLGFSSAALLALFALVQVTALLGSIAIGGPTDRHGPRWAVRRLLLWWTGVVVAAFFATTQALFWGVAILAGLGLGGIQSASRAFMSRLIPDGREAEFFGFYALCGKTGAILGPVVLALLGGGRAAVLSVAAFYVVGYLLLGRVRLSR